MRPQYYLEVLQRYVDFKGRASRSEYWNFALFNFLVSVVFTLIDQAMGSDMQVLSNLYSLAVLLPSLAVGVRRLHDTNHSGWWYFILLIPIIGWIWFFVLLVTKSDEATNKYGAKPTTPMMAAPKA